VRSDLGTENNSPDFLLVPLTASRKIKGKYLKLDVSFVVDVLVLG
jgi:hypothetical protein